MQRDRMTRVTLRCPTSMWFMHLEDLASWPDSEVSKLGKFGLFITIGSPCVISNEDAAPFIARAVSAGLVYVGVHGERMQEAEIAFDCGLRCCEKDMGPLEIVTDTYSEPLEEALELFATAVPVSAKYEADVGARIVLALGPTSWADSVRAVMEPD